MIFKRKTTERKNNKSYKNIYTYNILTTLVFCCYVCSNKNISFIFLNHKCVIHTFTCWRTDSSIRIFSSRAFISFFFVHVTSVSILFSYFCQSRRRRHLPVSRSYWPQCSHAKLKHYKRLYFVVFVYFDFFFHKKNRKRSGYKK